MNEMPKPEVSFIVPTYRRNDFLKQCLVSILCQKGAEFEIVVVDQNENASAKSVVEGFEDKRVRYLPYTLVMGVSAARNHALGKIEGKYVAFVDDDDRLCNNYLERVYSFVTEDADKPDFVWCGQKIFSIDNSGIQKEEGRRLVSSVKGYPLHYALKIGAGGMFLKSSVIKDAGGFDETLTFSEDRDLVLELLSRGYVFKALEELLYMRFYHQDARLSHKSEHLLGAKAHRKIYNKHKEFLQKYDDLNSAYLDLIGRDYYLSGDAGSAIEYGLRSLKVRPYRVKAIRRIIKYQWSRLLEYCRS